MSSQDPNRRNSVPRRGSQQSNSNQGWQRGSNRRNSQSSSTFRHPSQSTEQLNSESDTHQRPGLTDADSRQRGGHLRGRGSHSNLGDRRDGFYSGPSPPRGHEQSVSSFQSSKSKNIDDLVRFINSLQRKDAIEHLSRPLQKDLWGECWKSPTREGLQLRSHYILVETLARFPASNDDPITFVPLSDFSDLIKVFISKSKDNVNPNNSNSLVHNVETAYNAILRLLKVSWDLEKPYVKSLMEEMLTSASDVLESKEKSQRDFRRKIEDCLDELDKPWLIKTLKQTKLSSSELVSVSTELKAENVQNEYLLWRKPTVGWLSNTLMFQPNKLPIMKVPRPGNQSHDGIYPSTEKYFETLIKLWIAITFTEGNSALVPHCRMKDKEKECGHVLWSVENKNDGNSCNCGRPIKYACPNRFHNRNLCGTCAGKQQEQLRGPPGSHASTHIYDAHVQQVTYSGKIFLNEVASRRPPQAPIHWRSTKRLCSPNLIAVIVLSSRGASIRTIDEIKWGEIAQHSNGGNDGKFEFKHREEGKLCITLFDFEDLSGHKQTTVNLRVGDRLAIIDCLTFSPEYIPVLIALELQKQSPVPFRNGELLNLAPRTFQISHSGNDVKEPNTFDEEIEMEFELKPNEIDNSIYKLINESNLEPIIQIRRHAYYKKALFSQLRDLVIETTLDPGQMQSFLGSLTHPVHCTQGPPGTGKSYTGVVITRALLLIRKLWIETNPSIGVPPILVLSYKNHAIDEFLKDLLQSTKSLKFIRIGGGCNEPLLSKYQERFEVMDQSQVKNCQKKLEELHKLRLDCRLFNESIPAIFASKNEILFEPDVGNNNEDVDSKKRRKEVTYRAAETLHNLLSRVDVILKELQRTSDDRNEEGEFVDAEMWNSDELWRNASPEKLKLFLNLSNQKKIEVSYTNVQQLYDGFKHYNSSVDISDIIWNWISGFKPLPQCSHIIGEEELMDTYSDDADDSDANEPFKQCRNVTVQGPANLTYELPPRNFCENHVLCFKQNFNGREITDCYNLALPGSTYCEVHNFTKCCFVLKHGGKCQGFGTVEDPYCPNHQKRDNRSSFLPYLEKSDTNNTIPSENGPICIAITKKKKPCSDFAINGTRFCRNHQNKIQNTNENLFYKSDHVIFEEGSNNFTKLNENNHKINIADETDTFLDDAMRNNSSLLDEPELKIETENLNEISGNHPNTNENLFYKSDHVIFEESSNTVTKLDQVNENQKDFIPENGNNHKINIAETDTLLDDAMSDNSSLLDEPELRIETDNPDEIEEADHIQHMREIFGIETEDTMNVLLEDDIEMNPLEYPTEGNLTLKSSNDMTYIHSNLWSWEMSLEERWSMIDSFLNAWSKLDSKVNSFLQEEMDVARKQFYDAELKAKAKVYEGKEVIGGTVVGCISRLQAIRATNPFAIIVEEASEVVEPLLFSCLGSSTCKFEQIGDHLQLAPSMMGKFDFEKISKMNVSMFQRLIQAPPEQTIPFTVLTIQRRMRKNIADLTRSFYKEITNIEDHPDCHTKTIRSKRSAEFLDFRNQKKSLLELIPDNGREIPGVSPHIYFWTHGGAQTKASVGMSKVNELEANMVCNLAKYLVGCGVPKKSIVCLTPYKGQLMLIRKTLMSKQFSLIEDNRNRDFGYGNHGSDSVTVSTVDRFQGDENDIAIVSLVIDSKSKTPFVKLQNRMIVLLSRARLGMFIVGNISYFENDSVPHWKATIDMLSESQTPDTVPVPRNIPEFDGIRIGNKLPICCPIHRENVKLVSQYYDLKAGFCTTFCENILSCSHKCAKKCHWPILEHNKRCEFTIKSPCQIHPRDIKCHEIFSGIKSSLFSKKIQTIDEALPLYNCDFLVEVQMPCTHLQQFTCAEESDLSTGEKSWPKCQKTAVRPYIYPTCKHEKICLCHQLADWERTPSLVKHCAEIVSFTPPTCSHLQGVKCYMKQQYDSGKETLICPNIVTLDLPRCGHTAKVSCEAAKKINSWVGESVKKVGIVQEGETYGEKDYTCDKQVEFVRKCGHKVKLSCESAFEYVKSPGNCGELIDMIHPECGHNIRAPCHKKQSINNDVYTFTSPIKVIFENLLGSRFKTSNGFNFRCKETVMFIRNCGHEEKITCDQAKNPGKCEVKVQAPNPICGHEIEVPCHIKDFNNWNPWKPDSGSILNAIYEDKKYPSFSIPSDLVSILGKCSIPIKFFRTPSEACGHEFDLKCWEAIKILKDVNEKGSTSQKLLQNCPRKYPRKLLCGHELIIECHKYSEYLKDPTKIQCQETVEKNCWNVAICGAQVNVVCHSKNTPQCETLIPWKCDSGNHEFNIAQCSEGIPSSCPECSMDILNNNLVKSEIDQSSILMKDLPEEFKSIDISSLNIVQTQEDKEFPSKKATLLAMHKSWLENLDIWDRPLFRMTNIFWFVKAPQDRKDTFDPKRHFKQGNLKGIELYPWTFENLKALCEKNQQKNFDLIVGYVTVCRVLTDQKIIPKLNHNQGNQLNNDKKQQKNWQNTNKSKHNSHEINRWVSNQRGSHGFDALELHTDQTTKLVIWDPFAFYSTHIIRIPKTELEKIVGILKTKPPALPLDSEYINKTHKTDYNSPQRVNTEVEVINLEERYLNGISLPKYWDGKLLQKGERTSEKNLRNKLNFILNHPTGEDDPFSGLSLLEQLLGTNQSPDLKLLKVLELLFFKYEKQADDDFIVYLSEIQQSTLSLHPLSVLASARLYFANKKTTEAKNAFKFFLDRYPDHSETWMTQNELIYMGRKEELPNTIQKAQRGSSNETAEGMWENLKEKEQCFSQAMEKLLSLTGLRKVKMEAVRIFKGALTINKMPPAARKENSQTLNYCFLGNPGTGKTTVARLFAQILCDCHARESSTFHETSAQKLKDDGTDKFRELVKKTKNGTLFIDEAYDLDPIGDPKGKAIVSELLSISENQRDEISFILAGYEDDMAQKLFSYNIGLKSRFEEIIFEDFNQEELEKIWNDQLTAKKWKADPKIGNLISRKLAKASNRKGFGNARSVRQVLEKSTKCALGRNDWDGSMELTIEDAIGEHPLRNTRIVKILDDFNKRIGWASIKQSVQTLVDLCSKNYQLELDGKESLPVLLNRLFLGNPGTGKTTCSQLYASLLKELNFLSIGGVVFKTASEFMGSHVGESQKKTNDIIANSRGKVLVIDEAYNLNDSHYGKQVLDVLVEKIQGTESDDIAVLLLGYEKQMEEMLRNQNPGLARRFSKDYAFNFEDFKDSELLQIFNDECRKQNIKISYEVSRKAIRVLSGQRSQANFGNAGSVISLIKNSIGKASSRMSDEDEITLIPEDIDGVEIQTPITDDALKPLEK
ncbi:M-phase phosphoprotein 8, partial [Nowakowskiella sp. JEL0078]